MSELRMFELLQTLDPDLAPAQCKLHLASWNGSEDPIDVYFAGDFNEWQSQQTQKNFERQYVVSLIALAKRDKWLFAGCFDRAGYRNQGGEWPHKYSLIQRTQTKSLDGRLIVDFSRPGRTSYQIAENWIEKLAVHEIRSARMTIQEFPGFSEVLVSKSHLNLIVDQQISSWKSALSSVAGIYVITDTKTGKHYVGKATGDKGIWGRWCSYASNGHGGNKLLRAILKKNGKAYANNFQFAIIETADTHANEDDLFARESHWKDVLQSRQYGYNDN